MTTKSPLEIIQSVIKEHAPGTKVERNCVKALIGASRVVFESLCQVFIEKSKQTDPGKERLYEAMDPLTYWIVSNHNEKDATELLKLCTETK